MIGTTVSHYRIIEKLGEVPKWPASAFERAVAILRTPTSFACPVLSYGVGGCNGRCV